MILNGLENHLMVSGDNVPTLEVICEKLSHRYKKLKTKLIINNTSKGVIIVVSIVTGQVILSLQRTNKNMIKKKNQKKRSKKEKN